MMFPLRSVTNRATLVPLAAFAVFLWSAPVSAGETPSLEMAQLEIGGVKLGTKKCIECLEQQEKKTQSKKKKHTNKGDKNKSGIGIGITIELPKSMPKKKNARHRRHGEEERCHDHQEEKEAGSRRHGKEERRHIYQEEGGKTCQGAAG